MSRLLVLLALLTLAMFALPGCYDYCAGCRVSVTVNTSLHVSATVVPEAVTGSLGTGIAGMGALIRGGWP